MEVIHYKRIDEKLYFEELDNGLKVFLLPKVGFSKSYGLFSTHFGSIDTEFIPINQSDMVKVPDGIAHFLEHKMFEMEDGDVSEKFARLGANTNAFTSSARTAYLFNTTSNVNECIELLLDFVQDIYLTNESVEKEKGIINQEIGMYDDDPDWRCYFGSIQNLYHNHPVKVDIAGDCDSVNSTDKDTLEMCYHTFYHPKNMMLFIVGNIDPTETLELIKQNQSKKYFKPDFVVERQAYKEPDSVYKKEEILKMDVGMPKIMVSIKINDIPKTPKERLKRDLSMNILLDLLFAKSSSLYEEWTNKGIVNDSFYGSFTQERDYSFIQMGGDTPFVYELRKELFEFISNISSYKITEDEFERVKRKNIGSIISLFNSPESIANLFSRYYFDGIMIFEFIDVITHLTIDDIYSLYYLFNLDYTSSFIIEENH